MKGSIFQPPQGYHFPGNESYPKAPVWLPFLQPMGQSLDSTQLAVGSSPPQYQAQQLFPRQKGTKPQEVSKGLYLRCSDK